MMESYVNVRFLLLFLLINLIPGEIQSADDSSPQSAAFNFLLRERRAVSTRITRMTSFGSDRSPGIVEPTNAANTAPAAPEDKPSSTTTESTETTTEEEFEGDTGGSDIINTLLNIGGALLNFFQDPAQAVSQLVETAKNMMKAGRSLAARGPEYIDSAKSLLEEANRLLETARKMSIQSQSIVGSAQKVARTVLHRPWLLPG